MHMQTSLKYASSGVTCESEDDVVWWRCGLAARSRIALGIARPLLGTGIGKAPMPGSPCRASPRLVPNE